MYWILLFGLILYIGYIAWHFVQKYILTFEVNLQDRYGKDSWVLVTGATEGQGLRFVKEFAKRGFNVCLSGYEKCKEIASELETKYNIKTRCIIVDFSSGYTEEFYAPFYKAFEELDISILVNNVGHRVGWVGYETMPFESMRNSIICGTLIQSMLTKLAINKSKERKKRFAIINITAQSISNGGLFNNKPYVTLPYLSVYEGANAFGFFHSNSIELEYGDSIDILTIVPGAVVTESTQYLKDAPFNIDCKTFVKNIIFLLGNYKGHQYAHWGHELSSYLLPFLPNQAEQLSWIGKQIAEEYMAAWKKVDASAAAEGKSPS